MKILVSAYACDPYRGSEPGVGWTAVCRMARKHDVFVLTDCHNREGWERGAREGIIPSNVHVRFLRDRSACSDNRLIAHLQSWMNYASFTRRILPAAQAWHAEENFHLCHQVTIAGWRMPSPLWRLPIPFVWGPIGGAGFIPHTFRPMLSLPSRVFERIRDINSWISMRSRKFNDCVRHTAVIFAANEETELFLKPFRSGLPLVRLPIASLPEEKVIKFRRPSRSGISSGPLRLFAGGNMEGRKGVSLALRALALVAGKGVDFHYTIAGGGPEISALQQLSRELGLEDKIEFHPGFSGDTYIQALHASDIYFLPSFRESTPVTLLEAYLAGCYPVVADMSAQGEIVRLGGGKAVKAATQEEMVKGLAEAILWCHQNRSELPGLVATATAKIADHFSSERYDIVIDDAYRTALENPHPKPTLP